MKIFVVIPSYNEESRIGQVLKDLQAFDYKIIVVDDASQDETSYVADQYPVTILRHKVNRGQGAALQTGNDYALAHGADIIVHFDADGQFLVSEISEIIQPIIENQADIVFGSRFLTKKSKMPLIKKKIYFPLARIVNQVLFGIKLSDPQSGFRAMSRNAAEQIKIQNDDMAHCSEIMAKAHEYKLKIKEVPITVIYHGFGQGFWGGVKIIKSLLVNKLNK